LAAETGKWRGGWSSEGMTIGYTGRYFAKWHHDGSRWHIKSETFVTLKRTGYKGADVTISNQNS
jgi:hypothetical protein